MEVLVVAGEASGDQHAADVVCALKRLRPDVRFFGMGGPKLAAQGVELLFGSHEISVMGLFEVLPKIPRILRILSQLERAARQRQPACALLVDVPDFNLRLAKRLNRLRIPVAAYVAPMVWAWRSGRARTIARRYDRLFCILPFEEAVLRAHGVNAVYVGHPLLDQLPPPNESTSFRQTLGLDAARPVIAVLPGSRRSEIARILPTLADVCRRLVAQNPALQVAVPIAPGIERHRVELHFSGLKPLLVDGRAAEVVGASDVAIVASGTATLEAALMRRPLVAVYRLNPLTYWVARLLVRLEFFSLVNLLAKRRLIPELLQRDLTPSKVIAALEPLWAGSARDACMQGLDQLRYGLGSPGAAERVATGILEMLAEKQMQSGGESRA